MNFKITTLKANLCNYSDAHILVSGTIAITGTGAHAAARQAKEKKTSNI